MTKKRLLLLAVLLGILGLPRVGEAQSVVSPPPTGPIWERQQTRLPLYSGQGAALSPDGKYAAVMGMASSDDFDNSLFLVDLETNRQILLVGPDRTRSVAPLFADQASFSPDGKRIIFVLRSGTWHYPSDICTIGLDGDGLRKLTSSVPYTSKPPREDGFVGGGASYQKYYSRPRYSPDGSRILLQVDDEVVGKQFAAIMDSSATGFVGGRVNLEVLSEGQPCCWSADGKAVYYLQRGVLTRMDLETRATRSVPPPSIDRKTPIGRMAGREWLAYLLDNGRIGWFNVEAPRAAPEFIGEWSVPGTKTVGSEELTLKGFDWSNGYDVLLWYQGEETERFEVVRIAEPASLSR